MEKFEKIFNDYVDSIIEKNKDNEEFVRQIEKKRKHSYDVRDNMIEIAKRQNLHLDEFIVNFIGLFHDIGRFYQLDKYGSFNDRKTCNHAKLSIEVLENEGIIHQVPYEQRPYIMDAIELHNLKELPRIEDRKMYLYCALIRDADKLDGFRLSSISIEDEKSVYYKDKSFEPVISDEVYNKLMNNEKVDKYALETVLECKIGNLSYLETDINFNATLDLVLEKGYIDLMVSKMQESDRRDDIVNHIKEYIEERLHGTKEE